MEEKNYIKFLNSIENFRFVLVNAGSLYLYFSSFQNVDEEEFGGAWELTKEGFMTSFAGFLVNKCLIHVALNICSFTYYLIIAFFSLISHINDIK